MTESHLSQSSGFARLGLAQSLLAVLTAKGFHTPTPIQAEAIPVALTGRDVIGIAQTGTGKTLAFGLPMLERIAKTKGKGLVILPTRELALQVDSVLQNIGKSLGLKTAVLIGGASMHTQLQQLKRNPHIIIATPGRFVDHMEQKTVPMNDISVAVLDEADRMFDIGFLPQITRILSGLKKERQTMLFSATMPPEITNLVHRFMRDSARIEVAKPGVTATKVQQELYVVRKDQKMALLQKLLTDFSGTVLVFSRTKHGAKKIAANIRRMGHTADEIHSNRSLAQRKRALHGFTNGNHRVLVATDIAARGIDVTNIELVINFDLPDQYEDYVHRVGRTGRAGRAGHAISFAAPEERNDVRGIERLIGKPIPVTPLPTDLPTPPPPLPHAPAQMHGRERKPFGHRGGGPRRFGNQRSGGHQARDHRGSTQTERVEGQVSAYPDKRHPAHKRRVRKERFGRSGGRQRHAARTF